MKCVDCQFFDLYYRHRPYRVRSLPLGRAKRKKLCDPWGPGITIAVDYRPLCIKGSVEFPRILWASSGEVCKERMCPDYHPVDYDLTIQQAMQRRAQKKPIWLEAFLVIERASKVISRLRPW